MNANERSVTIVITCQIEPGKVELARREIADVIATVVAKESACGGIRLLQDIDDPNRLILIEHWDSKEAFTGPHMQTPHMRAALERAKTYLVGSPAFYFCQAVAAFP